MTDRPTAPLRGDRPRVVTLIDRLTMHGGAERFALQVAMGLDSERFESIMCVSRWPLPRAQEHLIPSGLDALARLEQAGVSFLPLRRTRKVDPAAWARLERFSPSRADRHPARAQVRLQRVGDRRRQAGARAGRDCP